MDWDDIDIRPARKTQVLAPVWNEVVFNCL
jgi:hypothetical protein